MPIHTTTTTTVTSVTIEGIYVYCSYRKQPAHGQDRGSSFTELLDIIANNGEERRP